MFREKLSTKHKNNAQASEFLSLSTKVEMVSTVHQNLPLIHASSIHATREPSVSSIKSVDVPPLDVIVESSPVNEPSPVTLTSSIEQRTVVSPLVSAAKAAYEQTDEGVCISIPFPPVPIHRNECNSDYEISADSDGQVGPFYYAV